METSPAEPQMPSNLPNGSLAKGQHQSLYDGVRGWRKIDLREVGANKLSY